MAKLLSILALCVIVLGAVAYFCPTLQQDVQTENRDIWGRNVWEKGTAPSSSESMSMTGYPYRFQGEILMFGGLIMLCGVLLYPKIKKEQHPLSTN